jgi:Mlc titration factor MtfA (ptsG expression regulator)
VTGPALLAYVVMAAAMALLFAALFRDRRPKSRQPLPPDWRTRLDARVPQARYVPPALQTRFEAQVTAFLRQIRFTGCDGLVVDDDMRIAVAGLACLLVLRPGSRLFPAVRSVLLYPDRFYVQHDEPDEFGLVNDAPVEQLGESWHGDRVVLSWADVEAALHGDAVNVVVHEFAHQLDDENPEVEGAPALHDYSRWSEVMLREYQRLQRHRRPPVLDPYGAESPGEFFGVVTEAFFQQAAALRQHHAELYALLRDYYGLDTAQHALWAHNGKRHER